MSSATKVTSQSPTRGSTKGTTLTYGKRGIRIKGNGARLTAEDVTKKLKITKGPKAYLRVFSDILVCVKGNGAHIDKGKGTFEYWATRVLTGRVIFEIAGAPVCEELAREGMHDLLARLYVLTSFSSFYDKLQTNFPPKWNSLAAVVHLVSETSFSTLPNHQRQHG